MNTEADSFFKALKEWKGEASKLRETILESAKLDEELKWSKPCYSFEDNNIAIIQPFKSNLALMFFKGALLKDSKGFLIDNGPNSQSAKRLEFRSVQDITKMRPVIKAYIKEAIAIEKSGVKVELKKKPEAHPPELTDMFAKKPKFKRAFEALTPGRQRAYILHFIGAKQSATRLSRIEKCMPQILAGKGMNE